MKTLLDVTPPNFIPLSGPASASKITSASASFPGRLPFSFGMIFTDMKSPVCLDIRVLQGPRGPEADGAECSIEFSPDAS